jgi:ABC-2 type transport system permease protein
VNYPLLLAASFLALLAVIGMAMAFGMLLLQARDSHGYGDLGASVLYVVSGAIFPISVLPGILATVAALSPLVYWMELIRRSLLGSHAVRMFATLSDADVLLRLVVTTVATLILAHLVFTWADREARRKGLIDMESNW